MSKLNGPFAVLIPLIPWKCCSISQSVRHQCLTMEHCHNLDPQLGFTFDLAGLKIKKLTAVEGDVMLASKD